MPAPRLPSTLVRTVSALLLGIAWPIACDGGAQDEPADPEQSMFSGPKADGFCAEPDSAEAKGILALVNDPAILFEELDRPVSEGGAGLDRRAAANIVDQRPFSSLEALDAVPFVGVSACSSLLAHACDAKGLCDEPACDAATFAPRPQRTGYDEGCEAILLSLLDAVPAGRDETIVDDATARCETLSPRQREAFDLVAAGFGTDPADFSDAFGELSVVAFAMTLGSGVELVHVIEENDFLPFHVVFAGDAVAAIWSSDGLSAGVDWYCGTGAEPAEEPEEFCVGALTDDAAWCDPASATPTTSSTTVADARADFTDLSAAAVVSYADAHGLGDDVEVEVDARACESRAAVVTLHAPSTDEETFRVVDSTRGLGRTVLTRTTSSGTEIVCATPNG